MHVITIQSRSLFIDDDSLRGRINDSNLMFEIHKDVSGDVVVVALKCDGCGYRAYSGRRLRYNTPSVLKKYTGSKMLIYQEKLRPLSGEIFRVRPIDFSFDESREIAVKPYFTKNSLVIPQMHFNLDVEGYYHSGMGIGFSNTNPDTISDGYIVARIKDLTYGKAFVDDSRLWLCGTGVKTGRLSHLISFLSDRNKNILNYSYEDTMDGLVFFRENNNG